MGTGADDDRSAEARLHSCFRAVPGSMLATGCLHAFYRFRARTRGNPGYAAVVNDLVTGLGGLSRLP